jgi:WD40 repeat protein
VITKRQQAGPTPFEQPAKVLDAPGLGRFEGQPPDVGDQCANLLDWSLRDALAVALGPSVYLWRPQYPHDNCHGAIVVGDDDNDYHPDDSNDDGSLLQGTTTELFTLPSEHDRAMEQVTSLGWIHDGTALACGLTSGTVSVWDAASQGKRLRSLSHHAPSHLSHNSHSPRSTVATNVAWNRHLLTASYSDGHIRQFDVRIKDALLMAFVPNPPGRTMPSDKGLVRNLRWSPDGRHLACLTSETLAVYDVNGLNHHPHNAAAHQEPVFQAPNCTGRALAWCPWQPGIVVAGNGVWDVLSPTTFSSSSSSSLSPSSLHDLGALEWAVWSKTRRQFHAGSQGGTLTVHRHPHINHHHHPQNQHPQQRQNQYPNAESGSVGGSSYGCLSANGRWLVTGHVLDECLRFWALFREEGRGGGSAILAPRLMRTRAAMASSSNGHAGAKLLTRKSPFSHNR